MNHDLLKTAPNASNTPMIKQILFGTLACVVSTVSVAACFKQSPAHTVALLELYTSEGCDSCPPANEWLSEHAKQFSPDQLVSIALHVDYWDYIGWKDQFANPLFGQRHRATVNANGNRTVYTPQFFVGSTEARSWRSKDSLTKLVSATNAQPSMASIQLSAKSAGPEASVKATFKSQLPNAQGYFALVENRLATHVTRGENAGATLKEDHVVRKWFGPYTLGTDKNGTIIERTFSLQQGSQYKNLSLASFVQDASKGTILQATATQAGECFK